ncbi:MAG: AAA domain-containing protein [Candidatus Spyradosoma sp.]
MFDLNLAKFHRAVAKLGSDAIFELPQNGSPQWCVFDQGAPLQPQQMFLDPAFVQKNRKLLTERELFLGGPCYSETKFYNNASILLFLPLFYRQVELAHETIDGTTVDEIRFLDGEWTISPKIQHRLEELGINTKRVENISFQGASTGQDVAQNFNQTILNQGGDAIRFNGAPEWVLFAPPATNQFNQSLIEDYDRLIGELTANPDKISGAMRALVDQNNPTGSAQTDAVLPFLPLNVEQADAVAAALDATSSISIVSGPPGCGKSQVVLSAILNAASRGEKVLFVSTNNQAVNVVSERFTREFKDAFPCAARTGNNKFLSGVSSLLKDARDTIYGNKFRTHSTQNGSQILKNIDAGKREKANLVASLKTAQRISQALTSALTHREEFLQRRKSVEEREQKFKSELQRRNLPQDTNSALLDKFHDELNSWICKIPAVQRQIDNDKDERKSLSRQRDAVSDDLERIFAREGLDLETHQLAFSLPLSRKKINDWLGKAKVLFSDANRDFLTSPNLKSEQTRKRWEKFSDDDLRKLLEKEKEILDLREKKEVLDEAEKFFGAFNLESNILDLSEKDVDKWKAEDSRRAAVQKNEIFSCFKRKWREMKIASLEKDFSPYLGGLFFKRVRNFDKEARYEEFRRLFEELRKIQRKIGGKDEFDRKCKDQEKLAAQSSWMTGKGIDSPFSPQLFTEAKTIISLRKEDELFSELKGGLGSAVSVWIEKSKDGKELYSSFNVFRANRDGESFQDLQNVLSRIGGAFGKLVKLNDEISEKIASSRKLERDLDCIPEKEQRIRDWADGKPKMYSLSFNTYQILPDQNRLERDLKDLSAFAKNRKDEEEQNKKDSADAEAQIAQADSDFRQAINLLPDAAKGNLADFTTLKDSRWLESVEQFSEFLYSTVLNKIGGIDFTLKDHATKLGRMRWLSRISQGNAQSLNLMSRFDGATFNAPNYKNLFKDALSCVPVWMTTAQSSRTIPFEFEMFDLIIVDEASNCSLTNFLPLLYRGKRLCVIGDDKQLPPIPAVSETTESSLLAKYGCNPQQRRFNSRRSFFETAQDACCKIVVLKEHFRSASQIIGFSNQHIYKNRLRLSSPNLFGGDAGVYRVDVQGAVAARQNFGGKGSWVNRAEARAVCAQVQKIRAGGSGRIGIVTPFRGQANVIENFLSQAEIPQNDFTVGTAHAFQGQEFDCVVFSPVAAQGMSPGAVSWVGDPPNLLNVALTRARKRLYVVGDFNYMRNISGNAGADLLRQLAHYCDDIEKLRDASPAELAFYGWMLASEEIVSKHEICVHEMIGSDEVDFLIRRRGAGSGGLVVEIDGAQHNVEPQKSEDQQRDARLRIAGYDLLRIPATDALLAPSLSIAEIEKRL